MIIGEIMSYCQYQNVDSGDEFDIPIFTAIIEGDVKEINNILQENTKQKEIVDNEGNTPLCFAAKFNNMDVIDALIKHNVNLEAINNKNETPLIISAKYGNIKTVNALINNNVEWITKNIDNKTAFTIALENKQKDIGRILMRYMKNKMNI